MPRLLNVEMISHPANWLIVTLMMVIAVFAFHQVAMLATGTGATS